jgi:phosphopantothenoylcysteine decarboxylase / phosphopantothenate---cysteine ligase
MQLRNKNIILGITGGIAAYKSIYLLRLLKAEGANVKVMMTKGATDFVAPLTFSTLSDNPVHIDFFDNKTGEWTNHVGLGLWADVMLIAPATANTLAKMAHGICDNLLLATYLSAKCPVFFAPAMDLDMYKHKTTKDNMVKLIEAGNIIIPAESGPLASGLSGEGRMAEPDSILDFLIKKLNENKPLLNKRFLITAGPTYEKIDPVRFIGNFSSGKMGFALAHACAESGAQVDLVCGPVSLNTDNINITRHDVMSAEEMLSKCLELFPHSDNCIMSAAIADFKVEKIADKKIKKEKNQQVPEIKLIKNPDVLQTLSSIKKPDQKIIGFALEDSNEIENATKKIKSKNLDFIILNSLNEKGVGFGSDMNKVTIIDKSGIKFDLPLMDKQELAKIIVEKIFL